MGCTVSSPNAAPREATMLQEGFSPRRTNRTWSDPPKSGSKLERAGGRSLAPRRGPECGKRMAGLTLNAFPHGHPSSSPRSDGVTGEL